MQTRRQTEKAFEGETDSDTLNERAAAVQPAGYGAAAADDPAELIAEQDVVQRTMARLPAILRECLILAVVGNFSTSEIAHMLDLQEAAVRQRLTRARKQFQQMYVLESGEQIGDNEISATTPGKASRHTGKHQNYDERFECRAEIADDDGSQLDARPLISRRNYAEGLS